jgi:hypothetical protein
MTVDSSVTSISGNVRGESRWGVRSWFSSLRHLFPFRPNQFPHQMPVHNYKRPPVEFSELVKMRSLQQSERNGILIGKQDQIQEILQEYGKLDLLA